jgi:hypothetical protein
VQLAESSVVAKLRGECAGGTGPDLTGFPHLTHAPRQWGEGVRVASNGAPAAHVAASVADGPIARAAKRHGVSLEEALDAYRYAKAINGTL